MSGLGVLYRYDATLWSLGVDEIGDPLPGHRLTVELHTYPIVKRTPQGAWIDVYGLRRRFVKLTAHKQYACETPELAAESFRRRKECQIRLLRAQLHDAERALKLIPGDPHALETDDVELLNV